MEEQNNKNREKGQPQAQHAKGGNRHHSRRGGRGRRGTGSGQEIRTKEGAFAHAPAAPKSTEPQQAKGGNRHHSHAGGGRRPDRSEKGEGATRVGEPRTDGGSSRGVGMLKRDAYVAPSLSRMADDKWMDDTFSSLHEVEVHDADAEEQARRILDAEGPLLFGDPVQTEEQTVAEPQDVGETVEVVGIRFKSGGKKYYFAPGKLKLARGGYAIVDTARGEEYGEVCQENTQVPLSDVVQPLRTVLRAANEQDAVRHEENKKKEESAFRTCQTKIAEHGLDMKLVEAQYTFDNSKLLFYFTSDGRVDFRELVKDLAGLFRTRIELRQIGIRDEAKLLGGLGTCGRPLCCYGFLPDFVQVSIKMAKEQNLSLNSTKISGCCGRLMCCLRYEFETYENEIRLTPSVGTSVETPDGRGEVISNHPLKGTVTVRLSDKPEEAPRVYHRDGVTVCRKAPSKESHRESHPQENAQGE